MKKSKILLRILPLVCAFVAPSVAEAQTTLFNASDGARIPAIVKTSDNNLVAFADRRENGSDVGGGRVEVLCKLSSDNGTSWGDANIVAESTSNNDFDKAHGDAAVVADRENPQNILVMSASGAVAYSSSTYSNPIRIGKSTSADGGATWGTCTDVTNDIYDLYGSSTVKGLFFSSGRICQSRFIKKGSYYRLYAALCTKFADNTNGSTVLYSDDFGASWSILGLTSCAKGGDEAKVEELPDGSVLLCCRVNSSTGRIFNIYKYTDTDYSSGSWVGQSTSSITAASCNGEILIVPAKRVSDSKYVYVALMSVAASSSRENVSIYYKELASTADFDEVADFTNTSNWTKYQIVSGSSCYSTMALNGNGDIAFLYEAAPGTSLVNKAISSTATTDYNVNFYTYSLSKITSAAYVYDAYLTTDANNTAWLSGDNSGSGSSDAISTVTIGDLSSMVGHVFTLMNKLTYTSNSTTTTMERYLTDHYNTTTCTPTLTLVDKDKATFDKSYYWVLSKDPDEDFYYLSNMAGDGYLGYGAGYDFHNGVQVSKKTGTCTRDGANRFKITALKKNSGYNGSYSTKVGNDTYYTDVSDETMEGYCIQYLFDADQTSDRDKYRVIVIAEDGTVNWSIPAVKGSQLNSTNSQKWSSDFIIKEVTFAENENGTETFTSGTTHSGFPVKFARHDDGYTAQDYEDYNLYASLNLPFAVTLDDDVTAYKFSSVTTASGTTIPEYNTEFKLEKLTLTDNVLPRETPVILSIPGTKNDGNVTVKRFFVPALAQASVKTGFRGVNGKAKFTLQEDSKYVYNDGELYEPSNKNIYFLSKKNGRVAFYYLNDQVMAANKAYKWFDLTSSASISGNAIGLNTDGTTAITMPLINGADNSNAPVYDLMGRRVNGTPLKGIYIKNGKKYIVK